MKDSLGLNFGLIIAFMLPGFIFLYGLSFSVDAITRLLTNSISLDANVGGFLFVLLVSLTLGLLISAVRWLLIDHLLQLTGVVMPKMNFAKLDQPDPLNAFLAVVENHYRYYQYYANSFVAILGALVAYLCGTKEGLTGGTWGALIFTMAALLLGSRDALKKYYDRAGAILAVSGGDK